MSAHPRPGRVLVALTLLVVLGTASCSGGDTKDEATTSPTSPTSTSTVPSGVEDSELEGPVGAVDMLTAVGCEPRDGHWRATATLTNTTEVAATFEVTFAVIRTDGNAVVGERTKTYDLPAGESTDVRVARIHDGDGDGLQCVPRVLKNS
jgi:hypothetical protein